MKCTGRVMEGTGAGTMNNSDRYGKPLLQCSGNNSRYNA